MKRHRKLLLFLLTPILLIAVLIALAFVPAVQTAVARRVLAAQPGITASVDHVAVGLTKVRINGLKFAQPGIMLDLPTLELDAPLLDAAKSKVHVQRLTANGWTATLSLPELAAASAQSTPSADTTPSAPFNGLFELIQLPVDLSIDTLESAGQVTLITAPGVRPIQVAAKLKGGNLAAGQTGKFTLSLQIEGVALPAALATATAAATETQRIEIETTIEARMSTPRSLENILLNLNAKTGAETALVKLAAYAANPAAGKPEEYSAFLDTKGTTRARVTGKWHPAPRTAEGDWMLNLGNTDLAPYAAAAGLTLPPFAADGQGAFTYALATGDATATGRLQVRGGLRDYIPELGNTELLLLTEFDAGLKSGHPRVEKFTATVSTGEPLVSIKTIQPFTLDTAKSTVTAADPTKDLLRIEIPGLPLTLVEPFLASSGIKLSGSPIRGAWVARLEGDTVRLATEQPLTLDITDLKQNGQTLAANLALSVQGFTATYSPKGWDATIGSITLATPNTKAVPALTLAAVARQLAGPGSSPITFDANGTMQPALLAAQPILAEYLQTLAAGKLTFTAQGTLADAIAAKASVKLDAFRIRATTTTSAATLPDVTLDADLARTAAGVLTIKTPITLTNASATPKRTSDLTINATLTPDPAKQTLDARAQITSNVFYIADAQAFAALAPPSPATTAPSTLDVGRSTLDVGRSAQSAAPPWAGLTGELSLALKKVVYTDELQITDIGGTIKITPEALTLDAIKAILGGASSLKLDGTLAYDAQKPAAAYALKTDLAVKNFETAPWLRALAAPSALDVGRSTLDVGRSAQSASPPPPVRPRNQAQHRRPSHGHRRHAPCHSGPGARPVQHSQCRRRHLPRPLRRPRHPRQQTP
ncbi:hypothetical protein [Geminisphaera colitermitum]|uniref:hypothetical protein n=1 Tax=Geminisphaera colitermitum TaxID=1148786 RepID=UPI0005BA466E|nr:hypothetical protein [Geminisphaera colitermitum]